MPTGCIKKLVISPLLLLAILLAACGSSSTQSVQTVRGGNRSQLIVYVVGFTETLDLKGAQSGGYGMENTFNQKNRINPYLQHQPEFKNAQTMVFSYSGFKEDGKPNPFACQDTTNKKIEDDARLLHDQINAYLAKHKNTDVISLVTALVA